MTDDKKTDTSLNGAAHIPASVLRLACETACAHNDIISGKFDAITIGLARVFLLPKEKVIFSLSGSIAFVCPLENISFEADCLEVNFPDEFIERLTPPKGVKATGEDEIYNIPLPDWAQPERVFVTGLLALLSAKGAYEDDPDGPPILAQASAPYGGDGGTDYDHYFLKDASSEHSRISRALESLQSREKTESWDHSISYGSLGVLKTMKELGLVTTTLHKGMLTHTLEGGGTLFAAATNPMESEDND